MSTSTRKVEPDPGAPERPHTRERRRSTGMVKAFAMAVAIGLAAVACDSGTGQERNARTPANEPSSAGAVVPDVAYTIDLNLGEMTPLPEGLAGEVYVYPVSPDGTMFAYNRGAQVYVASVDGTGEREVTPGGVEAFTGSWSPDGSLFVYQGRSGDPDVGNIFVVDVTTEEVRRITDLKLSSAWWWYLSPIFSPDGTSILFQLPRSSDEDTRWDVWSVPVAGGEPTLVRRDASMGAYAPDGETLAYLDSPRGNDGGWSSSLWLADGDGSDPRLLADGDGDFLRWSPDGTRIAFAGDGEIRVVDVATGETSHVVEGGTAEWVDDDTLVVSKFSLTG